MATILAALFEILKRPTMVDVLVELFWFLVPLWLAVLVGLFVGWVWKPKWAKLGGESSKKLDDSSSSSSSSSLLLNSDLQSLGFGYNLISSLSSLKAQLESCISWISDVKADKVEISEANLECSSPQLEAEKLVVSGEDLEQLCKLVEENDGGPQWHQMMDRSTETMTYHAWRRDPENGPPQYRSRTVFEDATPELVRNFFWDDEFRSKWDDMLIYSATLEECPKTGTMVVHWIRKFPFFCSDREYTIGRRIWQLGGSYYCVTKGVPCFSVPRRNKPRRVELYYSSWCIRAVESKRGDGQLTACEVLLFHYEDMGIPWNVAKWGVQLGMWDTVKKIEPGLRAYQIVQRSGAPLSRTAFMAQINTKINPDYLLSLEDSNSSETQILNSEKPWQQNIPKVLVLGGAIALACGLDRGLLTKAIIFGVARRFGRRL